MTDLTLSDNLQAGAGPTGLILALALRQNNISVRIIEKDTEFHKGQRGSGNQPRTLELYNALGTLPDILKEGLVPMPVASYKIQDGKEVVLKMDMVEVGEPTPDVPFVSILLCHFWYERSSCLFYFAENSAYHWTISQ